jgi:hypothetical protein
MSSGHLYPVPSPESGEPPSKFHVLYQVNDLVPEGQQLRSISPDTRASDALKLMRELGYSQLPVVHNGEVVGVFSHRSFADGVLDLEGEQKLRAEQLPVLDFVEQLPFAEPNAEADGILDLLDRDNAVLVGSAKALVGIATPMDALRYFYRLTSAFLILQEIERALRLILASVFSDDDLERAVALSMPPYRPEQGRAPKRVEDLSFGDYVGLIGNRETWAQLQDVFGTSRELVLAKLRPINQLRNEAFHFRRDLVKEDYDRLMAARGWLRIRLVMAGASDRKPT